MTNYGKIIVIWFGWTIVIGFMGEAYAQDRWFASLYGGRFSDNALLDILRFQTDIEESDIYVLAIGRELGRSGEKMAYEAECQLGFHKGQQSHQELNAVIALRWLQMPWDRFVDSSVAVGNGLSFATDEPPLEKMDQKDNKASRWLYYLYAELAFEPYKGVGWDMFLRVHHRSGVFGLFHGIDSGSNFIGIGIRYHFFD